MRVMNIMLAKVRGGVEAMSVNYHRALVAEGAEVLSLGHPEGMLAQAQGVKDFQPVKAPVNYDPRAAFILHQACRRFRPDLVLTHGNRATGICTLPLMATRDRTIQVMHNDFSKSHLNQVRAALCVSESVLTHVRRTYPGTLAVEVRNFSELVERPVKASRQPALIIGGLGRMHEQKGFDVLIEAAAQLKDRGFAFQIRLAGDGPMTGALKDQVTAQGLEAHIAFCGWQASPVEFLAGLDIFVAPSRYEPFGLVVIEAMAAGVPVLASNLEGPQQILETGRFGRLFESENPKALAEAILQASDEWETTRYVAGLAQRHAIEQFGFSTGRKRLYKALEDILAADLTSAVHATS